MTVGWDIGGAVPGSALRHCDAGRVERYAPTCASSPRNSQYRLVKLNSIAGLRDMLSSRPLGNWTDFIVGVTSPLHSLRGQVTATGSKSVIVCLRSLSAYKDCRNP